MLTKESPSASENQRHGLAEDILVEGEGQWARVGPADCPVMSFPFSNEV